MEYVLTLLFEKAVGKPKTDDEKTDCLSHINNNGARTTLSNQDLQLSSVGSFERYEIRVSNATMEASFPHSITCVMEVMLTTPIVPGPRRSGIHSMYACAAAV
jgi:hypothetical protein